VIPPAGTTFTPRDITEHPQFALSPDGTRLAFVANAAGERPQIWVRSLASGGAQPLPGTEGGTGPFWSPDSQNLAFLARGKLKRVSLGGAAPVDLADAIFDVQIGAWSSDGVILFSGGNGGSLRRVSANGGEVVPVTALDATRNETAHRWPQFLSDGRRFILFVGSVTPANTGIYLASLDSTTKTQLLNIGTSAVYAEPGFLLFEQNGSLMRQAFDATTGTLTGQPESLGDTILGLRGPGYLPASASRTGSLAYWGSRLAPTELVWFDRTGRAAGRVGEIARHDSPTLSPDDTKLLVTTRATSNDNELWRFDLATGASGRLTFSRGVARFGIWSPDSQNIVFSAPGEQGARLFQKPASGAGQESLLEGPGRHWAVFPDDWSRDGRWLAYVVTTDRGFDIWALDVREKTARPIVNSPANDVQPRFSPDGRWLAYASDETGEWQVYVQGFGDVAGRWQVSRSGGGQPTWRGDGKELFFLGLDGRLFAVTAAGTQTFEPGSPQALFQTAVPSMLAPFRTGYATAADGQRFLLGNLRPDREPTAITLVLNWTAALSR
jgi:eukaryotic-like serine/threonine-protein kinase